MTQWVPRALVVGSGLAGLVCARELARRGLAVTVVTPGRGGCDGATHRVHALAPWILVTAPGARGDSAERFLADLKRRGAGAERPGLAEVLAEEAHGAAAAIAHDLGLVALDDGPVLLPGDESPRGRRLLPAKRGPLLANLLRECRSIGVEVEDRTLVIGLLTSGDRAAGVVAVRGEAGGFPIRLGADIVVLACGGSGAVFPLTTSPRWCRGSGIALAAAAGALLHRPELTQALPVTATPPAFFPTSELILTGRLLADGEQLRVNGDLAAATLAIASALRAGVQVYLDPPRNAVSALPRGFRESDAFGRSGLIRLAVAAHHGVGGVAIDSWGRTSLPGLYACGEAGGGVQGERRTMGTGLLEARIFASRAAVAGAKDVAELGPAGSEPAERRTVVPARPEELEDLLDELMGALVAARPASDVAAALRVLAGWPASESGHAPSRRAGLAALRWRAAVEMLTAMLDNEAAGLRADREESWMSR